MIMESTLLKKRLFLFLKIDFILFFDDDCVVKCGDARVIQ